MTPAAWAAVLGFLSGLSGLFYALPTWEAILTPANLGILLGLVVTLLTGLFARTPTLVKTLLAPVFGAGKEERRDHTVRK